MSRYTLHLPGSIALACTVAACDGDDDGGQPRTVTVTTTATATAGNQLLRDDNGNALGGIRTPQLDVPIATLFGAQSGGNAFCFTAGTTLPFDEAKLHALYPDHLTYFAAFLAATEQAVDAGFILRPDAELMKLAASQSDIGS